LRNRARRLPQRSCQLKRDRDRQVAKGTRRWDFDGKGRHIREAVLPSNRVGDGIVHSSLNGQDHVVGRVRGAEGAR
jgi:hypothetical protein